MASRPAHEALARTDGYYPSSRYAETEGHPLLEVACSLCPSPTKCSNTQALEEGGTYRGLLGGGRGKRSGKRSTILTRLACLPFVPPHQELYAWNPLPALSFRATPSLPSHPSSSSCPSIPAADLQHQSGPGYWLSLKPQGSWDFLSVSTKYSFLILLPGTRALQIPERP